MTPPDKNQGERPGYPGDHTHIIILYHESENRQKHPLEAAGGGECFIHCHDAADSHDK